MGNPRHPSSPSSLLASLLAVLSLLAAPSLAATKPKNAILLSEVQSLTLRGGGAQTAHRRVAAAPQLKCLSHRDVCRLHDVGLMRCTNQGSGYSDQDIQWSCTANLPPTLKLGSTDVICEGYASSDDEYVLKGSCGVEYRLVLTDEGEKRYPHLLKGGGGGGWWGGGSKSSSSSSSNGKSTGSGKEKQKMGWDGVLFSIAFVGILFWMIYSACVNAGQQANNGTRRQPRNRGGGHGGGGHGGGWGPGGGGGGFGGGGWGEDDDPPPPYKPGGSSSQAGGWQPGFFSGAATGAAAGYYAGSRANRRQEQQSNAGGSSWFGGSSSSSTNNESSSSSSARYESTGFGSTSRR